MFVDETGTANGNNHFGVVGVVFKGSYAYNEDKTIVPQLKTDLDAFKNTTFGRSNFIFHLDRITGNKAPFRSQDGVTRKHLNDFYSSLPSFLSGLDFKIIFVSVDKSLLSDYFTDAKDAYAVAFAHIMKSFFNIIKPDTVEKARIIIESRDDYHDFLLQKAFFDIFNGGTAHLEVNENVKRKIKGLNFVEKDNYHPGLEIADLICNPLERVMQGLNELRKQRVSYPTGNPIFSAIQSKIYIGNTGHTINNWGFKKVPFIS